MLHLTPFEKVKLAITKIYHTIEELEFNNSWLFFDTDTKTANFMNKNRRAIYSIVPHKEHFTVFKTFTKTRKKRPSSFQSVRLHFRVTFPEFRNFKPDKLSQGN